jgi:class 3 adenylate cyclase
MTSPPRASLPLAVKLGAAFAVLGIAPLAATGLYVVDVNRTTLRILSQHLEGAVGDEVARAVTDDLRDAEDAIEGIGRVLVDASLDPHETERLAVARLSGESALDHVVAWNGAGALLLSFAEDGAPALRPPDALPEALRREAEANDAATGDTVRDGDETRVLVVVPLRADEETVTGYLGAYARMPSLTREVGDLAAEHFSETPDAILVTDVHGHVIAGSMSDAEADAHAQHGIFGAVAPDVPTAWSGPFTDADGHERIGVLRPVTGRPFRVVVQVPTETVLASITDVERGVFVAVALAILVSVLAGLLVARGITRPLDGLVRLAADLGARRFDRRAEVKTKDELAVLGAAMNGAAQGLEESEARILRETAIRTDLGRYLPAEIVERVVRREQDMSLGGTRRTITVLFADVVAFTPLTTKLKPEDTVTILNELFTILTEIVFRHGGTVDKFIGDSVMAIYGAPSEQADHAARAVRTAEEMLRWLEAGNATWKERFEVTIELAIGIHTGEAVVGNVGSETRMEYTAIGDTVNVAARLEALARPQQILVTSAVKDAIDGEGFELFDGGERELPGRKQPVHVWEVST